jgi:hypothetical protein
MGNELHPSQVALLRFFEYEHLPEHLQRVSKPFHDLAHELADLAVAADIKADAEFTTSLRKLLEAKDCAVRAAL